MANKEAARGSTEETREWTNDELHEYAKSKGFKAVYRYTGGKNPDLDSWEFSKDGVLVMRVLVSDGPAWLAGYKGYTGSDGLWRMYRIARNRLA